MSDETGLEESSLEELFRSEVESHLEVLGAALLALERAPGDLSRVDEMMRSAHSIKGAARVVRVDPAARVAHVMEDCFIAVQRGALTLSPGDVDVLLRGVDLLGRISEATRSPSEDLAGRFEEAVAALVAEIGAVLAGRGHPAGPLEVAAPGGVAPDRTASGPPTPRAEPAAAMPVSATLAFPEYLDAAAAQDLRVRFLEAIERGCDTVRIDLRGTRDLDVQGLALLAAIPRHAARHGRPRLRLAGASPEMEAVLRVTGLDASFGVAAGPAPRDS